MILNQQIKNQGCIYELYPKLPRDKPIAMLMRHSEREDIEPTTPGNNVPLTPAGRVMAEQFAKRIGGSIISTETSPLPRCVETALFFAEASTLKSLKVNTLLGDPGVFIHNPESAWNAFLKHGVVEVAKKLFHFEEMDGFYPVDQACIELLSYFLKSLQKESGLHTFISHDFIIAVFAGIFMKIPPKTECWPDFLESIFLWQDEDKVAFFYKNNIKILEIPAFAKIQE